MEQLEIKKKSLHNEAQNSTTTKQYNDENYTQKKPRRRISKRVGTERKIFMEVGGYVIHCGNCRIDKVDNLTNRMRSCHGGKSALTMSHKAPHRSPAHKEPRIGAFGVFLIYYAAVFFVQPRAGAFPQSADIIFFYTCGGHGGLTTTIALAGKWPAHRETDGSW